MKPVQPRPSFAAVAARPPQSKGKGKTQTNNNSNTGSQDKNGTVAEDWEAELLVEISQVERGSGKGKGASVTKASGPKGAGKNQAQGSKGAGKSQAQGPKGASKIRVEGPKGVGKSQAQGPKGVGKNQAEGPKGAGKSQAAATTSSQDSSETSFELAKKANEMAKKALQKVPEKQREGKLPQLRNLLLKKLKLQEKNAAQNKSGNEAKDDDHQVSSKKRKSTDASDVDERPEKKTDRKKHGADDGTSNIKATDPEGRKYDFDTIVVNMANVGATFSKKVLKKDKH
eukprot:CAMPEP_0172781594 /NCGR_PEP_ID=MMETSP1074-20121228/203508_1 /TAXON_ID=2916 /ORGANISM="Ceratium fusus, Strain PA161109" /LENGTH=284 /DNA_ID=CAMNT_0013618571 /DNA_START=60 /DNA_END=911 /DNA_ORIENTATION=+